MAKIRKEFRLCEDAINHILLVAKKNNLSETAALERIIYEHSNICENENNKAIISGVVGGILEGLDKPLTRIRLGANGADRNTQIIIELLNSMFAIQDISVFISTQKHETEIVKEAKDFVKGRIDTYRKIKLDKENKAKKDYDGINENIDEKIVDINF